VAAQRTQTRRGRDWVAHVAPKSSLAGTGSRDRTAHAA